MYTDDGSVVIGDMVNAALTMWGRKCNQLDAMFIYHTTSAKWKMRLTLCEMRIYCTMLITELGLDSASTITNFTVHTIFDGHKMRNTSFQLHSARRSLPNT